MAVFPGGYNFYFYFGLLRFFLRDTEGYYVTVVSFMLPYLRDHENNIAKGWEQTCCEYQKMSV